MDRYALTQAIEDAMDDKGLTYKEVADGVGMSPVFVTAALLGQMALPEEAAAKAAGNVITFGQASDMGEYAPLPRVSSIIDNWAPYYVARTKAVMDGSWATVQTWDGIAAGMVGIGEITDAVPEDVKAAALKIKDDIASGADKSQQPI